MDFNSYLQEWRGRRVDFNHDAKYLESDLIQEYLFECYGVTLEIDTLRDLHDHLPEDLDDKFYITNDPVVNEGDIVFLNDFTHAGIATGEQDTERFEVLEQNAVGSQTGIGDDAIRTNYYEKAKLSGQLRARYKPKLVLPETPVEPEPIPEPVTEVSAPKAVVQKPHKFAHGAVKVPLQTQRILVKVNLDTYSDPGHAVRREKPLPKKLPQGMQDFDLLKQGMLRVAGTTTWVNPADNVIKPKASPRKDTRGNYDWFSEPRKYKADRGYMKNHTEGEVFSWTDKPNAKIKFNQPVWIAGTCTDGEFNYGLPANPKPDGSFTIMKDFGILMSYLSLVQMDYEPEVEDLIDDVQPAEAVALIPRPVSIKDNVELTKFRVQKLVDTFIKKL